MSDRITLKVALVDDEPWVLEDLKNLINWEQNGFKVCAALPDAEALIDVYNKVRPHLVISDIKLNGMSGLELLEEINIKHRNETVFALISAFDMFKYTQQAIRLNAFDYLIKPIDKTDLEGLLLRARERVQFLYGKQMEFGNSNELIENTIEYIGKNYTNHFSLNELAAQLYVNPSYLSNAFKQKTGTNISTYITEYRMNAATDLLKNTCLSICEIAEKVGYNDYFYFCKTFKKIKGISPNSFRNK